MAKLIFCRGGRSNRFLDAYQFIFEQLSEEKLPGVVGGNKREQALAKLLFRQDKANHKVNSHFFKISIAIK